VYYINVLVFTTDAHCVVCEMRSKSTCIIQIDFSL